MKEFKDIVQYLKELEDAEQAKFNLPKNKKNLIESNVFMPAYIQSVIEASIGIYASAHRWHLLTESFSEHEAFNEFYESMITEVDSLSEKLISDFGKMLDKTFVTLSFAPYSNYKGVLDSYKNLLNSFFNSIDDESIKDSINAISGLIQALEYKLENLK